MIGLVLVATILFVAGCSKLTTENYDKLTVGMEYSAVVDILGQADECSGAMGLKKCRWGDDAKHILVNFAGDKVVLFSGEGL